ncbi:MAG: hypothetical protein K6E79_06250 [Pseudobutyrivibrio sp.]|nr:hypothetical protein [Pseudobutyrivibrio sp.]
MSTLIYCKNSIAASPYYIEEASLNVYSLEELSYFILNNVYLLSNKLESVELCNWIGRELKQKKLSEDLMNLVQSNAPLHIFVGHILASNGYASPKEIKDLLSIIATFENKSESERKKMRADRLMKSGKYVDAIYEYETLLSEDVVKTMSKTVEGDVYHNLGCAFAKLFLFDEAVKSFDEAYKKNQKKQSLYCLLYSIRCMGDKELFDSYIAKYQVSPEYVEDVREIVKNATVKDEILSFNQSIQSLVKEGDNDRFSQVVAKVIDGWKDEYIKTCRI